MNLIPVDDPTDERLRHYVSLRDTKLRTSMETEAGIFIAEGQKVIRRALETGYTPISLMLAPKWLDSLQDLLSQHQEIPIYLVSEELAEKITGFHVHRGALGAFARKTQYTVEDLLQLNRIVVAEDIVDHANVGAIFRSTAALGWDGVLLAPRAADPLYRRSIKVAMGAAFYLPWARLEKHWDAIQILKDAGFTVAALALQETSINLDEFAHQVRAHKTRVALLMGTEGDGLSQRWISQADVVVTIPMYAGIDSLNVAAATAVTCHAIGPWPEKTYTTGA